MHLQHRDHRSIDVVGLRRLGVQDIDWISPARHSEDGRVVKVLAELFRVQRGRGDEQLEVGPEARDVLGRDNT